MSVAKVIEILAESENSWEDAAKNAVAEASESVRDIRTVYVKDMQAIVENNRIARYRVNVKITFVVKDERD